MVFLKVLHSSEDSDSSSSSSTTRPPATRSKSHVTKNHFITNWIQTMTLIQNIPSPSSSSHVKAISWQPPSPKKSDPPSSPSSSESSSSSSESSSSSSTCTYSDIHKIPKPITPIGSPTTKTFSKSAPSERLQLLNESRRKSFQNPKTCVYVLKKGVKKGSVCGKKCFTEESLCRQHCSKNISCPEPYEPHAVIKKRLRPNRMVINCRYYFVKKINDRWYELRSKATHFILLTPEHLRVLENPTFNHYLVRGRDKKIEWGCLKPIF